MKRFCQLVQPEQLIILDELERQILKEFDFKREAACLQAVRNNLINFEGVVVPKPLLEYCNDDVIVMEFIQGKKLLDGIMEDLERQASRAGYTLEQLKVQNDFTLGQKAAMVTRTLGHGALDSVKYMTALSYNSTLGWVTKPMTYPPKSLDKKKLYDTLLRVQAHQMFVGRVFQGNLKI